MDNGKVEEEVMERRELGGLDLWFWGWPALFGNNGEY